MALNVKPLYPFDHPEVTHPEMEVDKVESITTQNNYNPDSENLKSVEQKILEIDLKKKLDIVE
ncbi:MAG: hypothetical protein ACHQYQ_03965 [Bacteriovoracales bacterium]|jgi:hypothetical protein